MPKKKPRSEHLKKVVRFRLHDTVWEAAESVVAQLRTMGIDSVGEYARVLLLRDLEMRGKLPPQFQR